MLFITVHVQAISLSNLYEMHLEHFQTHFFFKAMRELRAVSEVAYEKMLKLLIKKPSRYQFRVTSRNHYIANNLSQSFYSWILETRFLPIIDLVDKIRIQTIEKRNQIRLENKWKSKVVFSTDKHFKDISRNLVSQSNDQYAKVELKVKDMIQACFKELARAESGSWWAYHACMLVQS